MTVHIDHRKRVKNRYDSYGLDVFDDHQVLELMLFYCVPRRDTNAIAHNLINYFGSFAQVMDAEMYELEKVEGVGHSIAQYICMIRDSYRFYLTHGPKEPQYFETLEQCAKHLLKFFDGLKEERAFLMGLDANKKLLFCKEIAKGDINAVSVAVRKITHIALEAKAACVILAHNHPSGALQASQEDMAVTVMISEALKHINVVLLEHFVFTSDSQCSGAYSCVHDKPLAW